QTLSERGNHAAGDEDVPRHGTLPLRPPARFAKTIRHPRRSFCAAVGRTEIEALSTPCWGFLMQESSRVPACQVCIPSLLHCGRGPCGAAGPLFCCPSAFFSVSRPPPEVGGATGAPPPGCVCDAGVWVPMIEVGWRLKPASHDSSRLVKKKPT